MPDAPFKIGDVVKLKSGGLSMTVDAVLEPDAEGFGPPKWRAHCVWSDAKGSHRETYSADILALADDDE